MAAILYRPNVSTLTVQGQYSAVCARLAVTSFTQPQVLNIDKPQISSALK